MEGAGVGSEVRVVESHWIRNGGPTVHFGFITGGAYLLEDCSFVENGARGDNKMDSTVDMVLQPDKAEARVILANNRFERNSQRAIVRGEIIGNKAKAKLSVTANIFRENVALLAVLDVSNVPGAILTRNIFNDPETKCEILSADVVKNELNIWEGIDPVDLDKINSRMCRGQSKTSVLATIEPSSNPLPTFINTYNLVKATSSPYTIDRTVEVPPSEIVIIDRATKLQFTPGMGIVVLGKLYVNGTPEAPVEFYGEDSAAWRGILVEKGGLLSLSNVIIKDAIVGILLDSPKVELKNVTVVRPVQHGIEVQAMALHMPFSNPSIFFL